MGILEQVLAGLDASRRTVGRNVSDLITDPATYTEKIIGHLRNQNAGVAPAIANGALSNRMLSPSERVQHAMETTDFGGGLGVIKPKGGNWLSGQVEGIVKQLRKPTEPYVHRNAEGWAVAPEYGTPMPEAEAAALRANPIYAQNQALNAWLEGPLTKYLKRDFASPTDPIRKLADQGILHVAPEELPMRATRDALKNRRGDVGMPREAMASTPVGTAWENAADSMVGTELAHYVQANPRKLQQDPWLASTQGDSQVYQLLSKDPNELGLGHLTDELVNSLREGRLRPEQLTSGNLSVEGAVRHVAEINALRAKKAEEALQADMEGMPIHKDYPDQGYSWRQLQHEDGPTLQKWLTQEGDAMGHCVGGYCRDVKSGFSSIYSLRDAKGRPHVTIETAPGVVPVDERLVKAIEQAHADGITPETPNYYGIIDKYEAALPMPQSSSQRIVQIKGKGNAAPKAEYLPFVQDFVRSGKWSEIDDAAHTGLSSEEIDQILKGTK